MSIVIKQREEGYRLILESEEWHCVDRKDLDATLKLLLDLKNKKGRIKSHSPMLEKNP